MIKKLLFCLFIFLLVVPATFAQPETPPEVREAAITALNTAIPNIGRPTSWRHVLLGAMSDSTLGCSQAVGTALTSPVIAYQVWLNYNGTEYLYHVSSDGRIVVPCDSKIPGSGTGPGSALTTPVATMSATGSGACTLTVNQSNIRASASTSAAIVRTTNANEVLNAIGRTADNSWYQVAEGWVAASIVVPAGNCGGLPVTGNATQDYGPCPANFSGYQPARLSVGGQGQVEASSGVANRVRTLPSTSSPVVFEMPPGTTFQVIGGPQCGNNIVWWEVSSNGRNGWTAESDFRQREYFVVPVGGIGGAAPSIMTNKPFMPQNVSTLAPLSTRFTTPVYQFAWSPNNTQFAVATDSGVQLYSYPDMQPLTQFNTRLAIPKATEEVSALGFDPAAQYLVIGYTTGAMRIMELNTGNLGLIRNTHTYPILNIDFATGSPARHMATASATMGSTGTNPRPAAGHLKVWSLQELDLATGEMPVVFETGFPEPVFDVAFTWLEIAESPNALAVTTATDLLLYNLTTEEQVYSYTFVQPTSASQLQPTFVSSGAGGGISAGLFFNEGNQLMQMSVSERQPRSVVTIPNGTITQFAATNDINAQMIAITNRAEPVESMGVGFYTLNTTNPTFAFPVASTEVAFNSNLTTLATIAFDGTLQFWIIP